MSITAAELQANLTEYLRLAATEDIYITESGKTVAKLTSAGQIRTEPDQKADKTMEERVAAARSLIGILPNPKADQTSEKSMEERMAMIESLFGILPDTMTLEEALDDRSREL